MNNAKIGTALIGGYVLGRRRKGGAALGLALAMAARRAKGGDLVKAFSPVLGNLNRQVRTELTSASKAAASSVLSAQADHLAEALHERTLGLQGKQDREEPREEREEREDVERDEEEPREEREDVERDEEEPREEEPREEEPREEEPREKKPRRDREDDERDKEEGRKSSAKSRGSARARRSDNG
ncbi:ABC transporter substrate-binding protein [Streptomyces sp. NPDC059866]|uniref:ABC transporter substrate-binding protein n=1 Tax=Streptomyces sp. NPDC059866 TaxID=3346978 RepID=UPI0036668326